MNYIHSPFLKTSLKTSLKSLKMTLDIYLFIFCLIIVIESLYDRQRENQYNVEVNYRLQRILNNFNYIIRTQ